MFGLSKSERSVRKEQEAKLVEMSVKRCNAQIEELKQAGPDQLDRLNDVVKGLLTDSRLPRDFKQEARKRVKGLSLDAMTRATDKALENAVFFAKADKRKEMRAWLGKAREHVTKAGRFGATEEFKRASEMAMDAVRQSGGVSHHGKSTTAKPVDKRAANR